MFERFTERARKVMHLANQEAQKFGQEQVGSEHILIGLARDSSGVASNVLKRFDLDFRKIRGEAEKLVPPRRPGKSSEDKVPLGPVAKQIVEFAHDEAKELGNNHVGTEHLLLALLRVQEGVAAQVLAALGLRPADVRTELFNMLGHAEPAPSPLVGDRPAGRGKARTTLLDSFGRDLTEQARQGKLDPVVGRREELEEILQVLSCLERNRLLLVGEPGVGKRTLIRGAARLLSGAGVADGPAPPRLVLLDLGLALRAEGPGAGDRLLAALGEARQAEVILAPEGLPELFAGPAPGLGRMFRAWVRSGPGAVLAAVTPAELQLMRDADPGMLDAFEQLPVRAASVEETREVLQAVRPRFEAHHKVQLTDGVLAAVAARSSQGEWGAKLPGIAIRLLDRVAARVHLQTGSRPTGLRETDLEIVRLDQEKDAAVAGQDFEKAAALRDRAEQLRKKREELVLEWEGQAKEGGGGVDERLVAAVAEHLRARETSSAG